LLDVQNPIQSYSSLNVTINEIASYGRLLTFAGGSTIGAISGFVNPLTDYRLYSTVWDGLGINGASFYKIYDNGSLQSLTNSGAVGSSNGVTSLIGAANGVSVATRFFDGKIQEIILYEIDQSANIVALNNNINAYYNIYTTSSTSTENAFVSTWYDQSGNNRHATQTATGSQPLIVSSGSLVTENGKPAVRFDGSTNYLETSTFGPISQPYTTFTHVEYASMPEYPYLVDHGSETGIVGAYNAGGGHRIYAGGNLYFGSSAVINTPYLYYGLFSGSNSAISINGATAVSGSPGGSGISKITLGAAGTQAPSTFFSGSFFEHLEYHSDQSANKALIENNINNYYNIYTGSNHGFVARWYDQSGNNRHATQTATGSQPVIVESGSLIIQNAKPGLQFDGVNDNLSNSTNLSLPQPNTIIAVAQRGDLTEQRLILDTFLDINRNVLQSFDGKYGMFAGSVLAESVGTLNTNQNSYFSLFNGASSNLYVNNSLKLNGNAGSQTLGSINIGAFRGNLALWSGSIQEVTIYNSNQTNNREPIEYGINNYYNIYTQPTSSNFATSSFTIQATPTSISGAINNKLTSGIPSSGPLGLITVSRTGSNSLTIARNGVTSSFAVPASGALSTGIYLGAINNNGLALGNSPLNLSFASVGTGLTNSDVQTLNRLVYQANYYRDPSIITNGLTLNLDSQNPSSYPGSGNTWFNLSESIYNATLSNGFSYSNNTGGTLFFDGVNNTGGRGVVTNYYPVFSSDFTINLWVNFSTYKQYQNIISSANDGNAAQGFWIEFGSGRGFTLYSNSSLILEDNLVSLTALSANTWHNVCVSRVGTGSNNLKLYVDNVLCGQNTSNVTVGNINQNLEIARYAKIATDSFFQGSIARIQIYNSRGFSSDEVSQNFNATRGRFGI
jgi:hypothetical protein